MNGVLQHVGVLGMRWGLRRASSGGSSGGHSSGGKKSSSDSTNSADHVVTAAIKKKKLSQLSNTEIQTLATRMQLEKQYKDMHQTKLDKGKKVVLEILGNSAKQSAGSILTAQMTKQGSVLVEKAFANIAAAAAAKAAAKAVAAVV